MNTKRRKFRLTVKRLEKKVDSLLKEVIQLRSMIVGSDLAWDDEGEFKPEFVREILATSHKKGKDVPFTTAEDFLRRIQQPKSKKNKK